MGTLDGKIAWVTGGGTGIGEAACLALAAAGAHVVISGRRPEPLADLTGRIASNGGRAEALALDVTDKEGTAAAGAALLDRHGAVDILVNSAGLNVPERHLDRLTAPLWEQVVDINLNGTFYCIAAVLPAMRMRRDGLIINVASWAGRHNIHLVGPAYAAAKHAVVALTQSINMEECAHGIRATALCPGEVATPLLRNRPVRPSEAEMARMLQPEDVGRTIRFVAEMPAHVCLNEILIGPTWNRIYLGGEDIRGRP